MDKRVLTIGVPANTANVAEAQFLSNQHFGEFELVIWDPITLPGEISAYLANQGATHYDMISSNMAELLKAFLAERHGELLKFLEQGRDLFVIARSLPKVPYDDGRGRRHAIDLTEYAFLDMVSPNSRRGTQVEWVGPNSVFDAFLGLGVSLAYSAILQKTDGIDPLFQVKGTSDIIGGFIRTKWTGILAFVPHPVEWDIRHYSQDAGLYVMALANLPDTLRRVISSGVDQPEWANSFVLPVEVKALDRITKAKTGIAELQQQISAQNEIVMRQRSWKSIYGPRRAAR